MTSNPHRFLTARNGSSRTNAGKRTAEIRAGTIYRVYWPAFVFGNSHKFGLDPAQANLWQALTRELTRVGRRPTGETKQGKNTFARVQSDRPDMAQVYTKGMVPSNSYTKPFIRCTLLDPEQGWCGFNGNAGRQRGHGYSLETWLGKVQLKSDMGGARTLLSNVAKLDVVCVGRHVKRWYSLADMQDLLKSNRGWRILQKLTLRIYAPEDFRALWRYRIAEALGFSTIPGADGPSASLPSTSQLIRDWIQANGVSQRSLAARLGVRNATLVSALKKSSVSPQIWQKFEELTR